MVLPKHLKYTFDNYFCDKQSTKQKEDLISLCENKFESIDSILINAASEMGGTHLMYAIYYKLYYQEESVLFIEHEYLKKIVLENVENLASVKFLFIDDFILNKYDVFFVFETPIFFDQLINFLKRFMHNGGKIIIRCKPKFYDYIVEGFSDFNLTIIQLTYSKEVIKQIANEFLKMFNDKKIREIINHDYIDHIVCKNEFSYSGIQRHIELVLLKVIKADNNYINNEENIYNLNIKAMLNEK